MKIEIASDYRLNLKPLRMMAEPVRIEGQTQWYIVNRRAFRRITAGYNALATDGLPVVCED